MTDDKPQGFFGGPIKTEPLKKEEGFASAPGYISSLPVPLTQAEINALCGAPRQIAPGLKKVDWPAPGWESPFCHRPGSMIYNWTRPVEEEKKKKKEEEAVKEYKKMKIPPIILIINKDSARKSTVKRLDEEHSEQLKRLCYSLLLAINEDDDE